MERNQSDQRPWDDFYARTMHLPSPQLTKNFLSYLPQKARILDFGTGSGVWTAAFLRDRPDLVIDALDKNIAQARALPANFAGQKNPIPLRITARHKPLTTPYGRALCCFFLNYLH